MPSRTVRRPAMASAARRGADSAASRGVGFAARRGAGFAARRGVGFAARRGVRFGAALLLAVTLAGCSGSGRPEVIFTAGGHERAIGPAQYCDVQLTECTDDQGAQAALAVPAGLPVEIAVPDEVSEAPWHVVFAYAGTDGQRVEGRSPVFGPGSTERYTLTLPAPTDRLQTAQVQVFGPAPVQNPQTGEIEFPTRGTWLLVNTAPDSR